MDKNEAEEVVKNTIEYANEEIKKSKKRYLKIFLSCLLALFVCVAIMFIIYKSNDKVRDVYAVVFVTDIDKMEMSEGDIIKEITSKDDIELVFDILAKLKEGTESINDFPVNATKIVKLNLIYSKDNVVVYAYMRDNKYYFETPYGGIFLTTEENYNKIKAIFNSAE